jgi:hypothetical protein
MAETLQELGCHKVHSDGALFTFVKNGKLQGLIVLNVDDLIIAGNEVFEAEVVDKLLEIFRFSKVEEKTFNYCGCRINRELLRKFALNGKILTKFKCSH